MSSTTALTVQQPGSENPAMVQLGQLLGALDLSQKADKETLVKVGGLFDGMQTMVNEVLKQHQLLQQEVLGLKSDLGKVVVLLKTEEAVHEQKEEQAQKEIADLHEENKRLAEKLNSFVSKEVFETSMKEAAARIKEAEGRAEAMQKANEALRQEFAQREQAAKTSMEAALQAEHSRITALDSKFGSFESRVSGVEGRVGNVEGRVGGVEGRVQSQESRFLKHFHFNVWGGQCFEYGAWKTKPYHQDIVIDPPPSYKGELVPHNC